MLVRFTVENFLSFNQRVVFNLLATDDTHKIHHVVTHDRHTILHIRNP